MHRLWACVLALAIGHTPACKKPPKSVPTKGPDAATASAAKAGLKVLWDKPSPYGRVLVVRDQGLRVLRFGRPDAEDQTAYDPRRPRFEPLDYVRMALLGFAFIKKPKRVLMVGLGGGSFLRHARRWAPRAELEAVEINPVVVTAAKQWFGFGAAGKVAVHVADGRAFVKKRLAQTVRYDLVFIDAYDAVDYPRHLGTRQFFTEVRRLLAPGGVVVANLSPNETAMRDALVKTFSVAVGSTACFYASKVGNTVVVGGTGVSRVAPLALSARVRVLQRHLGPSFKLERYLAEQCDFKLDAAPVLTNGRPAPK